MHVPEVSAKQPWHGDIQSSQETSWPLPHCCLVRFVGCCINFNCAGDDKVKEVAGPMVMYDYKL